MPRRSHRIDGRWRRKAADKARYEVGATLIDAQVAYITSLCIAYYRRARQLRSHLRATPHGYSMWAQVLGVVSDSTQSQEWSSPIASATRIVTAEALAARSPAETLLMSMPSTSSLLVSVVDYAGYQPES